MAAPIGQPHAAWGSHQLPRRYSHSEHGQCKAANVSHSNMCTRSSSTIRFLAGILQLRRVVVLDYLTVGRRARAISPFIAVESAQLAPTPRTRSTPWQVPSIARAHKSSRQKLYAMHTQMTTLNLHRSASLLHCDLPSEVFARFLVSLLTMYDTWRLVEYLHGRGRVDVSRC